MGHSTSRIIDGIAAELWLHAGGDSFERAPEAAYEAAESLVSLYEQWNNLTLAELAKRSPIEGDLRTGRDLAIASLFAPKGPFIWVSDVMQVPPFEVSIDGDDLVWAGGSAVKSNPWPGSEVQSLLFDTEIFSTARAKAWAKAHGYQYGHVDTTERYHRLRQSEPDGRPCRTISFGESGVKAVVCAAAATSNPSPWIETHRIVLSTTDTPEETIPVMAVVREDGTQGLYTASEWQQGAGPDWTVDRGRTLLYRGDEPIVDSCTLVRSNPVANPIGDEVDVVSGPGRGRRGVVESESPRVARVRFTDRGGSSGHLERSALRTRGPQGTR